MTNEKETVVDGEMVEETKEEKAVSVGEGASPLPVTRDSAEALIAQAIEKNLPVETMERLLAMRRELKQEWAKEQYDKAMAAFQAECPTIQKTKEVKTKSGIVAYRYAPIETIVSQVKEVLKKHGFSYSIQTVTGENRVKSICIVKHKDSHSENYEMEVPLGNKTDIMSASQVVAAASTFSKRYAFCNAFGILTGDEDNDGNTDALVEKPARQASQPKPAAKQGPKKNYCSRCFSKEKKKVEISAEVAKYSKENYGFELCRGCQNIAKRAKEQKEVKTEKKAPVQEENKDSGYFDRPGTINKAQVNMIKVNAKRSIGHDDEEAIINFIGMYGFQVQKLSELSYKQAKAANDIILANIGEGGSL
jgi:hypothetical protein